MDPRLFRTDLNLLWALHVLLEERNVTRAASRLFISQPAMSKTLRRLRTELDDPLFVRSRQGLLPTPRAVLLAAPLGEIFTRVRECLEPPAFDYRTASGVLRIAAPEQFAVFVVPRLVARLRQRAPGIDVIATHLGAEPLQMLSSGALDFIINLDQHFPPAFHGRRIYAAAPAVWCRRGHALSSLQRITLKDLRKYPRLTFRDRNVSPHAFKNIERHFQPTDLGFRVILDTSQLLVAIDTVMRTDALMMGPQYLAAVPLVNVSLVPLPVQSMHEFAQMRIELALIQHARTLHSPLHRWITDQIIDSAASRNSEEP